MPLPTMFASALSLARTPSRAPGLFHQGGTNTPKPLPSNSGPTSRRKAYASSTVNLQDCGRAVRRLAMIGGKMRAARPNPASSRSWAPSNFWLRVRRVPPRALHAFSAGTSRLGSSLAWSM